MASIITIQSCATRKYFTIRSIWRAVRPWPGGCVCTRPSGHPWSSRHQLGSWDSREHQRSSSASSGPQLARSKKKQSEPWAGRHAKVCRARAPERRSQFRSSLGKRKPNNAPSPNGAVLQFPRAKLTTKHKLFNIGALTPLQLTCRCA